MSKDRQMEKTPKKRKHPLPSNNPPQPQATRVADAQEDFQHHGQRSPQPLSGGDQPCVHLPFVHLSVQWDPGLKGQVARVCERSWAASLLHLSASICLPRASAHRGPQSSRGSVSMQLLGLHLNTSLSPQERKNTSPIPSPRRVGQMIEWVCLCMFGGLAMHACRCCEGLSSVCTPLLSSLYSLLPSWAKSGFTAPSSNSSLTVWGSWVGILH